MSRAVYKNNKQYSNVKELENAVKRECNEIDIATMQELVCSMKNRKIEVINHKGGNIKYKYYNIFVFYNILVDYPYANFTV